jgi:hypothetical protein
MGRYVYTEKGVIDAIFDITDGSLSQYQASEKYGVPQPVLSKRLSGQKSRKESTHPHQRVSPSQEDRLVRWLLRQESLGYALTHSQLRSCVKALLRLLGDNKPLGRNWSSRFSSVIQTYLPSLENARKPPDLTDSLRRRSIGTSISGRTSTAGSSLRTQLTWTRAA